MMIIKQIDKKPLNEKINFKIDPMLFVIPPIIETITTKRTIPISIDLR